MSKEMLLFEKAFDKLTYLEREIFKLRTGLADGYCYTFEEIGRIFKISPERVRQAEIKSVQKIKHFIKGNNNE